jgi:hypothetical protein
MAGAVRSEAPKTNDVASTIFFIGISVGECVGTKCRISLEVPRNVQIKVNTAHPRTYWALVTHPAGSFRSDGRSPYVQHRMIPANPATVQYTSADQYIPHG